MALKLETGFVQSFPAMIQQAGVGQPAWLSGWFGFWSALLASNPVPFAYTIIALELLLSLSLIFGVMRKVSYCGGFLLSMSIWAIPEGFGGPYGPGSTDIGPGIIYAFVFVLFMILDATHGPSGWTIDRIIEKRWPKWDSIAEMKGK